MWGGVKLYVLKNDEFDFKFHIISNVAEVFGGRPWAELCQRIFRALSNRVQYDHACLTKGTLRLPYQFKDNGKVLLREAGVYRSYGFYDNAKFTSLTPPNLDTYAVARMSMELWSLFGREDSVVLSSLGAPVSSQENRRPVANLRLMSSPVRVPPPSSPSPIPLAERSPNQASSQIDEGVQGEMTDAARSLRNYCQTVMQGLGRKSVSFEFGYRCSLPHLGDEAIRMVYADIAEMLETDYKWDSKTEAFKEAAVRALNKHICYNLSDNTIIYRMPISTDSGYMAVGKAATGYIKQFFAPYKIKLPVAPSEKAPNGSTREYSIFNVWCTHHLRQSVANILFVPYPEDHPKLRLLLPLDCLNSYRGYRYTVEEMENFWNPARSTPTTFAARVAVARYLLHLCYVWCRGYVDRVSYALFWLAKKLQLPYWKPTTTMVLIGREGAGKTSQVDMYGHLFGTHYFRWVNSARNIAGFSHPDQEFALFTLLDEMNPVKDEQMQSQMRMLISDVNGTLHLKHQNERKINNFSGYIFLSNNYHAVMVSASARRYCVLDCLATLHPKDSRHQAYMSRVLELATLPDNAGYKALGGFYMDKRIFPDEILEAFKDGSGLPVSIEKLLGTQRAMGQDGVGIWVYTVLDRGYIVPPEQNPLHPVNSDAEVSAAVAKISDVGYRLDVDYDCPVQGDTTPVHKTGRSWAHVMLSITVYGSYRSWFNNNKSYSLGPHPDPADRFWEKMKQYLPSVVTETRNRLRLKQQCFMLAEARAKWLPGVSDVGFSTVHANVERDYGASKLIQNDYHFVIFSDLHMVRQEYIHNSGRNDVHFNDLNEGLVFMSRRKEREPREHKRYEDPAEFLKRFGFTPEEIEATFPGKDISEVFLELGNTPTNIGREVEACTQTTITLPDVRNERPAHQQGVFEMEELSDSDDQHSMFSLEERDMHLPTFESPLSGQFAEEEDNFWSNHSDD